MFRAHNKRLPVAQGSETRLARVQVTNRGPRFHLHRSQHHANERQSGDTRGAPCEYDVGDGKGWVRVASRPGAARLKGVSYSSLRNGLKRKDIWTAPNGVRFRNVSDSFWGEGDLF